MVDLRKQTALHEAWWNMENTVPLVENYCPIPVPCGGLDIDVPVEEIAERKLRNAEAMHDSPGLQDTVVKAGVNFATALYPAVAGAGFKSDGHTSWTVHTAKTAKEITINKFDPGHSLYAEYLERLEEVLKHWSWETYLPVAAGYDGPFDILSGFLGPEVLSMELFLDPEGVKKAALDAAEFMTDIISFEKKLFQSAGLTDHMLTLFGTWQPGWAGLYVEDFSALIGPHHYREFILEVDTQVTECFDSVMFHTHSAGYKNIEPMLELPAHVALEIGNDPKGPDLDTRIEVGKSVLADNRPLVLGSWNIPLPAEDLNRTVENLPPEGLNLRFQCDSVEQASVIYDCIKNGEEIPEFNS